MTVSAPVATVIVLTILATAPVAAEESPRTKTVREAREGVLLARVLPQSVGARCLCATGRSRTCFFVAPTSFTESNMGGILTMVHAETSPQRHAEAT